MKATLEFDLPEERAEFAAATHGQEWKSTVEELDQTLRNRVKYGPCKKGFADGVQWARDELFRIAGESNLVLHEDA